MLSYFVRLAVTVDMQHTSWIGSMERRARGHMDCALWRIAIAVVQTNSEPSVLQCSLWVLHYLSFSFLHLMRLLLADLLCVFIDYFR